MSILAKHAAATVMPTVTGHSLRPSQSDSRCLRDHFVRRSAVGPSRYCRHRSASFAYSPESGR